MHSPDTGYGLWINLSNTSTLFSGPGAFQNRSGTCLNAYGASFASKSHVEIRETIVQSIRSKHCVCFYNLGEWLCQPCGENTFPGNVSKTNIGPSYYIFNAQSVVFVTNHLWSSRNPKCGLIESTNRIYELRCASVIAADFYLRSLVFLLSRFSRSRGPERQAKTKAPHYMWL